MFLLTLDNGATIKALDHTTLESRWMRELNIKIPEVNFFIWQTYPDRSYGRIVVHEEDFWAAIENGSSANAQSLIGTLTISDFATNTRVFNGVSIRATKNYLCGIKNGAQNGKRLLVLELELQRFWFDSSYTDTGSGVTTYTGVYQYGSHVDRTFNTWSDLTDLLYIASGVLISPLVFNKYIRYKEVPIERLCASITAMNGLTAFPHPTTIQKAAIGTTLFDPSSMNEELILYAENGTTNIDLTLSIKLYTERYRYGNASMVSAGENSYQGPILYEDYRSSVLRDYMALKFAYPYELVDLADPTRGGIAIQLYYANQFAPFIIDRLANNFHYLVHGVASYSLDQTLNYIKYSFTSNGFVTQLKSKPFEIYPLQLIDSTSDECVFVAQLTTNMNVPIAEGNIYHTMNLFNVLHVGVPIYDPLNLVQGYCSGTRCYVYKTVDEEFVVISGPCPPTTPCPPVVPPGSGE